MTQTTEGRLHVVGGSDDPNGPWARVISETTSLTRLPAIFGEQKPGGSDRTARQQALEISARTGDPVLLLTVDAAVIPSPLRAGAGRRSAGGAADPPAVGRTGPGGRHRSRPAPCAH